MFLSLRKLLTDSNLPLREFYDEFGVKNLNGSIYSGVFLELFKKKILKNTKVFYLDSLSCSLLGNFCDITINESHDCSCKPPTVIVF